MHTVMTYFTTSPQLKQGAGEVFGGSYQGKTHRDKKRKRPSFGLWMPLAMTPAHMKLELTGWAGQGLPMKNVQKLYLIVRDNGSKGSLVKLHGDHSKQVGSIYLYLLHVSYAYPLKLPQGKYKGDMGTLPNYRGGQHSTPVNIKGDDTSSLFKPLDGYWGKNRGAPCLAGDNSVVAEARFYHESFMDRVSLPGGGISDERCC